MSDDQSPGDARKPYSDRGGAAGRHAETHDVRREQLTNPRGAPPEDPSFDLQMAPERTGEAGGHADESRPAADDKRLRDRLSELSNEEMSRLSVLQPGTRLEQGGTYVDLADPARVPFKALAGHDSGPSHRYVAKRDTDYELWNRLVGQETEPEIDRSTEAAG